MLKLFWGCFLIFAAGGIAYICNVPTVGLILTIIFTLLMLVFTVKFLITGIKEKDKGKIIKESISIVVFLAVFFFSAPLRIPGDFSDHTCQLTLVDPFGNERLCGKPADGGLEKAPMFFEFEYFCSDHLGWREVEEYEPSSDSGSGFSNKYGTPTTKCYISGCNNYIASSGDTNCCTTHSNLCLNCSCYIDSDAMYCMDCLEDWGS